MKHLLLSLFLCVLLNMIATEARAYNASIDGIFYVFSDSDAIVTYYKYDEYYNGKYYKGDVVIPEYVVYQGRAYEVTAIGHDAFMGCEELHSITIPNSITSIGSGAFKNCSNLTTITIPNGVTCLENEVFSGCSSLSSIIIPEGVTSIGNSTFEGCSSLPSFTIPNSVVSVGERAFLHSKLKSLIVGTGVKEIGSAPATKVIWLTNDPPKGYNAQGGINYVPNDKYKIPSENNSIRIYPFINSIFESDGIRYVPVSPSERTCDAIDCLYDSTATNITVGKNPIFKGFEMTIQKINPYIFYENPFIKTVKWGYGETIPEKAFRNCANLYSIEIGDNIKSINESAFEECSDLQEIDFGCGLLTILDNAFKNCMALSQINIPKNVAMISDYAFEGCSKLKNVNIEEPHDTDNSHLIRLCDWETKSTEDSKTYNFEVVAGDILTFGYSFRFPDGGTFRIYLNGSEVYKNAGSWYSSSRSYFIHSFDKAQSVSLVFSIHTPLASYPWFSVYNLEVGNGYSLTSNPKGEHPLFANCPLETVHIGRNINYLTPEGQGLSPFYNNTYLKSVYINKKETKISDNEFEGCTSLKDIYVGDEITSIGKRAFSSCSSLEKYTFGGKVTNIGSEAFSGCAAIKQLICQADIPPTCGPQAFEGVNQWDCTLFVPKGSVESYKTADIWKDFFFIEESEGNNTPDEPVFKKCAKPSISYSKGTLQFFSDTDGATCISKITDSDITSFNSNEIQLGVTYNIKVYATKPGYENSDIVTATLCWIDVEPRTEGIEGGVAEIGAHALLIQAENGQISIEGAEDGTKITAYGIEGVKAGSAVSYGKQASILVNQPRGSIVLLKIGGKSVKVIMQ